MIQESFDQNHSFHVPYSMETLMKENIKHYLERTEHYHSQILKIRKVNTKNKLEIFPRVKRRHQKFLQTSELVLFFTQPVKKGLRSNYSAQHHKASSQSKKTCTHFFSGTNLSLVKHESILKSFKNKISY